ncbi:MAG: T9SS type A sorting domain-containing protein, partial [Bacteroidales bacterium]|nr:T9SS type A sorting domain-containing protein [Bacteroidales bacterium]
WQTGWYKTDDFNRLNKGMMIKLYLITALLTIGYVNRIYSQEYESVFGSESTSWNLFNELNDGFETDSTYVLKDTTVNETLYKMIYVPLSYNKYLRETEDRSQVYQYSPEINDSEFLVFDLNLEENDTFIIGYEKDTAVVDSVFYLNEKKHIRFDYEFEVVYGSEKFEFIEGIGTNFGLVYQGVELWIVRQYNYLLCAYKNGELTYSNKIFDGECYLFWTPIHDIVGENFVKIYPNPASDKITIELGVSNSEELLLMLYNSDGTLTDKISQVSNIIEINTSDKPAGLYFFTVFVDDVVIIDKFLIVK